MLDGEIVAFDEQGALISSGSGQRIQTRGARARRARDLACPSCTSSSTCSWSGRTISRGFPLEARKAILELIVGGATKTNGHRSAAADVRQRQASSSRCAASTVSKASSRSEPARRIGPTIARRDWVKIKCELDAEFVVVGWTEGEGDRARARGARSRRVRRRSLVVRGQRRERARRGHDRRAPRPALAARGRRGRSPKASTRRSAKRRHVPAGDRRLGALQRVHPNDGAVLRFPVFRGIRPDLSPKDCTAAPDDGRHRRTEQPTRSPPRSGRAPAASCASAGTTNGATQCSSLRGGFDAKMLRLHVFRTLVASVRCFVRRERREVRPRSPSAMVRRSSGLRPKWTPKLGAHDVAAAPERGGPRRRRRVRR